MLISWFWCGYVRECLHVGSMHENIWVSNSFKLFWKKNLHWTCNFLQVCHLFKMKNEKMKSIQDLFAFKYAHFIINTLLIEYLIFFTCGKIHIKFTFNHFKCIVSGTKNIYTVTQPSLPPISRLYLPRHQNIFCTH